MVCQRTLDVGGTGECVGSTLEDDEEGITLRIYLGAIAACESRTENRTVIGQYLGIARPKLLKEQRRAFDVGEEKRHRSSWQLRHASAPSALKSSLHFTTPRAITRGSDRVKIRPILDAPNRVPAAPLVASRRIALRGAR